MKIVIDRTADRSEEDQPSPCIKRHPLVYLSYFAIGLVLVYLVFSTPFETSLPTITMKNLPSGQALLQAILSYTIFGNSLGGKAISGTANCHTSYNSAGPTNPSFETGTLAGWTVISGDAFGSDSVSSQPSYWGGPINQINDYFLWGIAASGDSAVGQLRSSTFPGSSSMSFLVGGGCDSANLYVGLVRERDHKLLLSQTGTDDEALIRIVWDTSAYAGENVYVLVNDNSTANSWGHINLDDIRMGCEALGDNGLTFNVLGQANQPARDTTKLSTAQLYSVDAIRPQFHYTPYQGWINDPTGLIQWNGRHQLFSQFNPAAPIWGPMYWSHVDSPDAVHWHELPVALSPLYTDPLDFGGRFTGSAVLDNRTGDIQVIFTDATDSAIHNSVLPEVISTAKSSDGINFHLYSGNPIVAAPPPGSSSGFRDPKVFWDTTDDTWKMIVGSGDARSGKVQLYVSSDPDLLDWEYVGVLFEGDGSKGAMWECPNFFPLDGKWALFYGADGLGWYEVGTYDGTTFTSEKTGLLDAGPDSYAMQMYTDSAGRNLAITWMGNWGTSKWPSRVNGWAGVQSITRELFLREDGGLGSKAIAEVAGLASGPTQELGKTKVHGTVTVGSTNTARLQLAVDLSSTKAQSFTILTHSSSAESVSLTYALANSTLTLDRTNAGYGQCGSWNAVIAVPANKILTFDILIDRSSVEIFAGDGTAMTANVFPRFLESKDIKIVSHGGKAVFERIALTPLGSTWS